MQPPVFEQSWMKRAKWLTHALIISGTLNIGLLATFIYFVLKEKQTSIPLELKPPSSQTQVRPLSNEQILRAYSVLSFQELLLRLENKDHVEEGFLKRDLALACLTAFHHFNLEKALGGLTLQKRQIAFRNAEGEEQIELTMFPGLADYQFQAMINYAKTEKWPFTSEGLFYEIKRTPSPRDPTLLETFYLTPEYHAVATLFIRSGLRLFKEQLVDLLAQGEWKMLEQFTKEQRQIQDLTPERRRSFLIQYLNHRSKVAAKILLETDFEFTEKKLDDAQISTFLDLLSQEKSLPLEALCKNLLTSPRSDPIRQKAAELLFYFSGEPMPQPFDYLLAVKRFAPQAYANLVPEKPILTQVRPGLHAAAVPPKAKSKRIHIVQEGESLWKISRKYHVNVENLMQVNHLDSEKLRPGEQLVIPEKKK